MDQLTETEQPINIREYVYILLQHKWIIIAAVLIMFLLTLWYNSRLVPTYRATTTMIIDRDIQASFIPGQRMDYESYLSETMTFNTHFKLITSRSVLKKVVQRLKLDQDDNLYLKQQTSVANPIRYFFGLIKKNIALLLGRKKTSTPATDKTFQQVSRVAGMLEIEPVEETRLLNINAYSPMPEMARDVADATAQAYIDFNIESRMASSQHTLGWLTENFYEMKKKLEHSEREFMAFKQRAKLVSMEDSQKVVAQKINDFNDAYIQARNKRMEVEAKLGQLEQIANTGKDIPNLRSLIENELINDLYSQLLEAEVELSKLGKVYKSKHPKVTQVRTKIENTRNKLRQEIDKEIVNLKAERSILLSKEEVLQKTMADFEKEAMETNKKELEYSILKRNVEINQGLYENLLARAKETDLTGDLNVSNLRIAEEAILPTAPVRPNKKRNLMLGIIIGLMIGVGISFFIEFEDRSIRTEADVEKYLGLSVLATIPLADQAMDKGYYGRKKRRKKSSKVSTAK